MKAQPQLRGYYWCEQALIGNLGDALAPLILQGLGYDLVTQTDSRAAPLNQGRCLLVIGSLLTEYDLRQIAGPVEVWGCGWKGICPPPHLLASLQIYAVRGPHTVAGLHLPPATPLGDPALLLPHLTNLSMAPHHRAVLVPHYHQARLMSVHQRRRLTGCQEVVSPLVIQRHGIGRPGWHRQARSLGKAWLRLGVRPSTAWHAVERIAGAGFVLTGSLHGAILAQAYGVPWAAYDDGYIDAPPKWLDWAAYLGIRLQFVTTVADGQQWWQTEGRRGRVRDLAPLLAAFPYPLPEQKFPKLT